MSRSRTRRWCLTLVPAGALLAALNSAATEPPRAAAYIPAVHADEVGWPEWLRSILCNLYQYWGGDCSELNQILAKAVAEVVSVYESEGAPQLADQLAVEAFLEELDALEDHLNSVENGLSTEDTDALRDMIEGLRDELGA